MLRTILLGFIAGALAHIIAVVTDTSLVAAALLMLVGVLVTGATWALSVYEVYHD